MGEITFVVDPEALNPDLVRGWIQELYSLPNVREFLNNPINEEIVVTDNVYSKSLSDGNRKEILNNLSPTRLRGQKGFPNRVTFDSRLRLERRCRLGRPDRVPVQ